MTHSPWGPFSLCSTATDKAAGLIYKVLGGGGVEEKECPSQGNSPHLLAILMLQVQPSLDVASGLLKGLALRHFSRVVCADPDDIGAEEEHHVSTQLQKGGWQG